MPTWINFKEIRERISLEDVIVRYYKITNLSKHGSRLVGPCPVHGGDSPRDFHAELERNLWHCFTKCQGGGNQLDLVAAREGCSVRDAALRLDEFFKVGSTTPPPPSPGTPPVASLPSKAATPPERNPVLDLKLALHHDHPHLLIERGLTLATAEDFGVGWCAKGMLRGTIAIPIHDDRGDLVAYAGRRLKPQEIRDKGKYKLPTGFRKELVLFNEHRARANGTSRIVLVEGFFSVFHLREAGIVPVVASMGCEVSEHQLERLAAFEHVLVLFDGDEAGKKGAAAVAAALSTQTLVSVATLPEGRQPDHLSARTLRWLVNGVFELPLGDISFTPTKKETRNG